MLMRRKQETYMRLASSWCTTQNQIYKLRWSFYLSAIFLPGQNFAWA